MPKHTFEFVVRGPLCSLNNDNTSRKRAWKQTVGLAAYNQWRDDNRSIDSIPINAEIEVNVTTYCRNVIYDVDNVLKWTLDGLSANERPQQMRRSRNGNDTLYKSIYEDDRLIYKLTSTRIDLNNAELESPPDIVNDALAEFIEFQHIVVSWEDEED